MGCKKKGHIHTWPTKGTLTIQRCEVRCNFCTGDHAYKDWKYAWFLRRHVRAMHVKKGKYRGMQVDAGWDDENPRAMSEPRRGSGSGRVKIEDSGSDADYGVPQTVGDLSEGSLPDFVTQRNFGNLDSATYQAHAINLANIGYGGLPSAEYGNLDAEFPTLADEYPLGRDCASVLEELQDFINQTSGYDGNPEDEDMQANEVEEEDNIIVANRSTNVDADADDKEEGKSLTNPVPTSSAGRFFMADVNATSLEDEDSLDDMPLADRMNNHEYTSQAPTDQAHSKVLQMMYSFSETMLQSGVDPRDMLPMMQQVMRTLHQGEEPAGFPY